ncbi:chorismate lyase, partial [Vibrio parahaemolyticus]|nr:chorismate lyase [Vibrio parahaemolyticus]
AATLKQDESQLWSEQDCLLSEVILCGDNNNWVIGRTLIPRSTLVDQQYDLAQQGDIPLGLTVFSADNVERDSLQMGWVAVPEGRLLARRSRLWMNHKPMLVAELFLSNSPVYAKETV